MQEEAAREKAAKKKPTAASISSKDTSKTTAQDTATELQPAASVAVAPAAPLTVQLPDHPARVAFVEAALARHKLIYDPKKAGATAAAPPLVDLDLLLLYAAAEAAAIDSIDTAGSSDSSVSGSSGESSSADVASDVAQRGWVLWGYPSTLLEAKLLVNRIPCSFWQCLPHTNERYFVVEVSKELQMLVCDAALRSSFVLRIMRAA
jgi:hypothetical protein